VIRTDYCIPLGRVEASGMDRNSSISIPECSSVLEKVNAAGYSIASFNIMSILVNVCHIVILSLMPSLRGSGYFHILLHLSIGDIFFALSMFCYMTFNEEDYFRNFSVTGYLVYCSAHTIILNVRYWIMTAASFDRYYALCHPMAYKTSSVIKLIFIWLPCIWAFVALMTALQTLLFHKGLCFSNFMGPWIELEKGQQAILVVMSSLASVITGILLIRVIVELFRMKNRNITQEEQQVKRAVRYVISIVVLYYCCFIPPVISYLVAVQSQKMKLNSVLGFYFSQIFVSSSYGVTNVLIYGFLTPAYRQRIRSLLKWRNQTAPENPRPQ
jgi:hypothetical protein